MRLRLVHLQSLYLLAAVLTTVLATSTLYAWNLRNGFAEFLAGRDVQRLDQFAQFVSDAAARAGGIAPLIADVRVMGELTRRFVAARGFQPDSAPAPVSVSTTGVMLVARPPLMVAATAFRDRVSLYGMDGRVLLAPQHAATTQRYLERPILIGGQAVAKLRMSKLAPTQDALASSFLAAQYRDIAQMACALLLVALGCARYAARRWAAPLTAIQLSTQRIAAGDFGARLDSGRSDEIGDVMRNVNLMAKSLEAMEGARRQWIADISHELRTPMAVLRGEIDALLDGVRPLRREALLSLREEMVQLGALVDDLHLLAMADLDALPCYFEELDVRELLTVVSERHRRLAQEAGISLAVTMPGTSAIMVCADYRRLAQLLGNLLVNSIRYTEAPGSIEVTLGTDTDRVLIDIEDSAPGVHTEELSRLFDPLFRADGARRRQPGGSGLGLSICRAIAAAHRGSISARASSRGGLHIHLALPLLIEVSA